MIRWTKEAADDFEAIRDYIEADNPAAAIRQSDLILDAIDQLKGFPISGRNTKSPRLRELVVPQTPYIIGYRLRPEAVIIAGIRHGARRIPRHLRR